MNFDYAINAIAFVFLICPTTLTIVGCMIVSPLVARRKGYVSYYWIFALHPVGLIVVANLTPLTAAKTTDEREVMQLRANKIAARLSIIGLLFIVLLLPVMIQWLFWLCEPRSVGFGYVMYRSPHIWLDEQAMNLTTRIQS